MHTTYRPVAWTYMHVIHAVNKEPVLRGMPFATSQHTAAWSPHEILEVFESAQGRPHHSASNAVLPMVRKRQQNRSEHASRCPLQALLVQPQRHDEGLPPDQQ